MQNVAEAARAKTQERLRELGFPELPPHLPLLADADDPATLRAEQQVIERYLVLGVRVSLAFGMPTDEAARWLSENELGGCLSQVEAERLAVGGQDDREQLFVESLWALAWALSLVDGLDPTAYCGDDLVSHLPDLRVLEAVHSWRSRSNPDLRSVEAVVDALDLHYGITWGLTHCRLSGLPQPGNVETYVPWFRRHALEFLLDDADIDHSSWDSIDLST